MLQLLHNGQDRSCHTLPAVCQLPILSIGLDQQYLVLRRPGQDFSNHYLEGRALFAWRLRINHLLYRNVDEVRSTGAWSYLLLSEGYTRMYEHNLRWSNRASDDLRQWHHCCHWETHKRCYHWLIFVFGSRQKHRDGSVHFKCSNLHYWARPFHTTCAAWQPAAQKTTDYHWLTCGSAYCRAHPGLHSKQARDQNAKWKKDARRKRGCACIWVVLAPKKRYNANDNQKQRNPQGAQVKGHLEGSNWPKKQGTSRKKTRPLAVRKCQRPAHEQPETKNEQRVVWDGAWPDRQNIEGHGFELAKLGKFEN